MKIIFDFSNLAVRVFTLPLIEGESSNPNFSLWRFMVIDSVYKALSKYSQVTDVILAADSPKSWRKIYWPRYKESRKGKRDKSKLQWNQFHSELDKLYVDIRRSLPFKVLKVDAAEGDDIVAIMAKHNNEECVIVSNDEDYLQLISDKIKVYNPSKQKYMECEDTEYFIQLKSLMGQSKDDIFNILTEVTHPVGVRKPGFGEVSAKKVLASGLNDWLEQKGLKDRYELNRNLIDFDRIPNAIVTRVLNAYNSYELPNPNNIYTFFRDNEFKSYLEDFTSVETKLMSLY